MDLWFLMSLGTTFAYAGLAAGLFYPQFVTNKMRLRDGFKNSSQSRWLAVAMTVCSLALTVYIWFFPQI